MNMHQVLVGTAICWLSEDITVDNSVCLKWKFNFAQKTNENKKVCNILVQNYKDVCNDNLQVFVHECGIKKK